MKRRPSPLKKIALSRAARKEMAAPNPPPFPWPWAIELRETTAADANSFPGSFYWPASSRRAGLTTHYAEETWSDFSTLRDLPALLRALADYYERISSLPGDKALVIIGRLRTLGGEKP